MEGEAGGAVGHARPQEGLKVMHVPALTGDCDSLR